MFNEWSVVILIGNILHVFGTTLLIINSKAVSKNGSLLVGFGTFFVWCSLLKYFQDVRGFNVVQSTVS